MRLFVLRAQPASADDLAELRRLWRRVAETRAASWSALMNLHWVARLASASDDAAWAVQEFDRRRTTSPFAVAYFARALLELGEPEQARTLLRRAETPPDGHGRLELALAAMRACAARGDVDGILRAWVERLEDHDGDRDVQHVVQHVAHAAEMLPAGVRGLVDPEKVEQGLRALMEAEPGEIAHRLALIILLAARGKRIEAFEVLVDGCARHGAKAVFANFAVHCAWRVLEGADPPRPN